MANNPWIQVEDYKAPRGWVSAEQRDERSTAYCEMLERGEILFFRELPFQLSSEEQKFLREQEWTELRMHKNVSYRPAEDVLRGVSGDPATVGAIACKFFRTIRQQVIDFAGSFLSPYKDKWILDFASFRPLEEEGRDLPLHKRNDLLHVDAFPSRPTRGGRILRIFTNLNPTRPRVWNTTETFAAIARKFAKPAGLAQIAEDRFVDPHGAESGREAWIDAAGRTPYDMFMLRFHDYLKENAEFQKNTPKTQIDFPPSGDLDCVYRLRGACGDVRTICDRADFFDSTGSAGEAGGGTV